MHTGRTNPRLRSLTCSPAVAPCRTRFQQQMEGTIDVSTNEDWKVRKKHMSRSNLAKRRGLNKLNPQNHSVFSKDLIQRSSICLLLLSNIDPQCPWKYAEATWLRPLESLFSTLAGWWWRFALLNTLHDCEDCSISTIIHMWHTHTHICTIIYIYYTYICTIV